MNQIPDMQGGASPFATTPLSTDRRLQDHVSRDQKDRPRIEKGKGGKRLIRKESSHRQASTQAQLTLCEQHLIHRLSKEEGTAFIPTTSLLGEMRERGYRGSRRDLSKWMNAIREKRRLLKNRLHFHKPYLISRLETTRPNVPPSDLLFREIQDRGYQGTKTQVEAFVAKMYKRGVFQSKVLTDFHRNYLIERAAHSRYRDLSASELFKQIQSRGYRGSLRTVQHFLSEIQKNKPYPETCFSFHKEYVIGRIEENPMEKTLGVKLFKEIQARGYRGTMSPIYRCLANTHKMQTPPETFLDFHREYLVKRMRETQPDFVPSAMLFREIRAKGYQGSISNLQRFLTIVRRSFFFEDINAQGYQGVLESVKGFLATSQNDLSKRPSILDPHKGYIIERLEESQFCDLSPSTLLKEIQARGYRGSLATVRAFITTVRRDRYPKKFGLNFHKDYLTRRIREAHTPVSGTQLFREIRDRGYRGSVKNLQAFLTKVRRKHIPETTSLAFHKKYLAKRIEETRPHFLKGKELFKEIQAKGYRGSLANVQVFLRMMRR